MKFKIEHRFSYGWDDAGWTDEDLAGNSNPARFRSRRAARVGLNKFLQDVEDAVAAGDMMFGYAAHEFRVVADVGPM